MSGHRDTPCEKGTSGHPIQDLSVEAAVGQFLRCCGCLLLRSAKNLNRPKTYKKKTESQHIKNNIYINSHSNAQLMLIR